MYVAMITSSTDSIEIVASLYFVGVYCTAKETYICTTCEKDRLVGCTIYYSLLKL